MVVYMHMLLGVHAQAGDIPKLFLLFVHFSMWLEGSARSTTILARSKCLNENPIASCLVESDVPCRALSRQLPTTSAQAGT
ncbi:hypothetical protein K431DRAFT_27482 [Polychaeton citri CBS 116435]|uniref:Uncharacterized protein n=1 Tax=Polychaeton citri CBS 116435 TaxID=1314669 RepID=A0A9P4QBR4_9PEZI|nr:hypothetical protein K431DRAFT_27482 [Polychaeton citri CBS 116435]